MSEKLTKRAEASKGRRRKPADKASASSWSKDTDLIIQDLLVEGEEILVWGQVHWGIYWKSAAVILIGLLVMLLAVFEIGVILVVAGCLMLAHAILARHFLLLILTNKRVLMRYGILQVDVVDMRFKSIESIELERMLPGFLMGYSNVVLMGIGQRVVIIPYIANGPQFRRKFNELTLDRTDG